MRLDKIVIDGISYVIGRGAVPYSCGKCAFRKGKDDCELGECMLCPLAMDEYFIAESEVANG